MITCQPELTFADVHSKKRVEKATLVMGEAIVNKIIGFALFLLGANRKEIAQYLGIPIGTFLSFLTRTDRIGLAAFSDQRKSSSVQVQPAEKQIPIKISLTTTDQGIYIQLSPTIKLVNIPRTNLVQSKVVLLTFVNSGLLSYKEIAPILGISERHARELNVRMYETDVSALIDKRKGQTKDYQITSEIKAELIQQFAANIVSGNSVSSRALSEDLKERCDFDLSDRTIRLHMQNLGLQGIKETLPNLIFEIKKTL